MKSSLVGTLLFVLTSLWACSPSLPVAVEVAPPADITFATGEHSGWVVLMTPSLPLVQQLCKSPSPDVLGCALWDGALHLKKPADTCFIVILDSGVADGDDGMVAVLKHEYKHCREGAYHGPQGTYAISE